MFLNRKAAGFLLCVLMLLSAYVVVVKEGEARDGRPLSGISIAIDAGHGGRDPGAVGPSGLKESTINLDIAFRLKAILEAEGATIVMTRTSDTYVSLSERSSLANSRNVNYFISIHCNAYENSQAHGTETYS
ncbi:MAG: N-acetylmuramoyl-L-alanine amidase, partial [Thermoplasmata archaeon]